MINLSKILSKNYVFAIAARNFHRSAKLGQQFASHQPTNLEKKFLVWTGKYKSAKEIPDMVSNDVMERCRNKIRIRVANMMMAATIIGCIIMVMSGKKAAERGETVTKHNLEWHKKYNEITKDTPPK